jgi:hypothetical protein
MWTVHVAKFISFPSTWRVECPHISVTQEAIMTRRTIALLITFGLVILVALLAAAHVDQIPKGTKEESPCIV